MAVMLKQLPTSAKLALSFFLGSVIIGTISALIMLGLLLTHKESGFAIPSVENIKIKYHYPALVSAMKTSMAEFVSDESDVQAVEKWIAGGATEAEYAETIAPIMEIGCVSCHNPTSTMTGAMPGMPLTSYQEVKSHTQGGYTWKKMSKQAHVHFFGIGTFLGIVTIIFAFTDFRAWFRNGLICLSWIALTVDVFSWWMTKFQYGWAYVIVIAGAAMSGSALTMCFLGIVDIWMRIPFLSVKPPREPGAP